MSLTLLAAAAAEPAERFFRAQRDFANAHNDFGEAIEHISPDSPDYHERLRREWMSRELGQKFRRLERSLE